MNRFQIDTIERNVTIPSVLDLHGVKRHGRRCCCPIHGGSRNSFSFTDQLFHCFTCGEGGGVIQLEAKIRGVDEDSACHILAKQFGLNIDRELSDEEKTAYKIENELKESYVEWKTERDSYYRRMSVLYRNIKDVPELSDMARDLEEWLDDNIEGVIQPWKYQNMI